MGAFMDRRMVEGHKQDSICAVMLEKASVHLAMAVRRRVFRPDAWKRAANFGRVAPMVEQRFEAP